MSKVHIAILDFYKKQKRYKQLSAKFDEIKKKFYQDMESVENVEAYVAKDGDTNISVKRIQNHSIIFDPEKLSNKLTGSIKDVVLDKKYIINDYTKLVRYLKQCGVNPVVFKKYVSVEYTVNSDNIKNLYDMGDITLDDIEGCYEVKKQNPYYKVVEINNE